MTKRAFNRSHLLRLLLLLLLTSSFILQGAIPVRSAPPLPQKTIGTTETINVYPSRVVSSDWFGVEHVLSSDLPSDAMYQDFGRDNAAYITDELPTAEDFTLPPLPVSNTGIEASETDDTNGTAADGATDEGALDTDSSEPVESLPSETSAEPEPEPEPAPQSDAPSAFNYFQTKLSDWLSYVVRIPLAIAQEVDQVAEPPVTDETAPVPTDDAVSSVPVEPPVPTPADEVVIDEADDTAD